MLQLVVAEPVVDIVEQAVGTAAEFVVPVEVVGTAEFVEAVGQVENTAYNLDSTTDRTAARNLFDLRILDNLACFFTSLFILENLKRCNTCES
jgi:hypothetical protein